MKGRQKFGNNPRPPLSENDRAELIDTSMACMVVQFHNNASQVKRWSKCKQRKHRHIGDAVNYLMWLVNEYEPWSGCVASAAIFDTQHTKTTGAGNKVYQYEKGSWKLVNPISW
ncbi:hypothetical protein [Arundinibacter roseus]|uniref:Uncharacterized protein n=1 Tax=Arundinibacter roseus TaxID=2070510 RepID=A0A4R4K9D5_9BACT|nr:hypothetical protein [Arundinibacter roseus]TDB64384.1 hypothetical protein EZE20_11920 [Arundinibacter roseus]